MQLGKIIDGEYRNHRERSWKQQGIHDLTWERFEKKFIEQGGRCANPFCESSPFVGVEDSRACADHCHRTGAFRGVLCSDCNQLEGKLRIERRLRTMIEPERDWFTCWDVQTRPWNHGVMPTWWRALLDR